MKYIYLLFIGCLLFTSCDQSEKKALAQKALMEQKKDSLFKAIDDQWIVNMPVIPTDVKRHLNTWNEWNEFENQFKIKPVTTLNAFKNKSKQLAELSVNLQQNIPDVFNKPDVKSRLYLLTTNLNSLEMLMDLDLIPTKEFKNTFGRINKNYQSIVNEFSEILAIKAIPTEPGEKDLIHRFDTVKRATLKAIPTE